MEVTLENGAPSSGLPAQVIGPYDERFQAGENRTYVSVYTPFARRTGDARRRPVDPRQPARPRTGTPSRPILSIPAESSSTLTLDVGGRVALSDDGWYRLDVFHQTSLVPDDVEVSVAVPKGWRIAEVQGLDADGDRRATAHAGAGPARTILVRVERTGWAGVWERLTTVPDGDG